MIIMKNKPLIIIAALILIAIILIFAITNSPEPQGSEMEILAQNLDTPWAIDFLPDNRIIFTERGGEISILDNGTIKNVGDVNANEISESGLLGVAVDLNLTQINLYTFITQVQMETEYQDSL